MYLLYNVYRNDLTVLHYIFKKKKRLNFKERDTFAKLFCIKN